MKLIALNKPIDVEIAPGDTHALASFQHVSQPKEEAGEATPIGTMGKETEGLFLFSLKGEKQQFPDGILERYDVTLNERLPRDVERMVARGVRHDGGFIPGVDIVKIVNKGKRVVVLVETTFGRDADVWHIFQSLGVFPISVRRMKIGTISLDTLPQGRWVAIEKKM